MRLQMNPTLPEFENYHRVVDSYKRRTIIWHLKLLYEQKKVLMKNYLIRQNAN